MSQMFDFNLMSTGKKFKIKLRDAKIKIENILRKITDLFFPFIGRYLDNRKIKQKLSSRNILDDIGNPDLISIDILKGMYSEAIYQKDKLEDKAKINIIGITIAISLILGATNLLAAIYEKYHTLNLSWVVSYVLFTWIMFILFFWAVLYLIIAGILAIKVLIDENTLFTMEIKSFAENDALLRHDYGMCISQNRNQNLIRNNTVYTSYECIRNALICLFILLVILVIPNSAI